MEAYDVSRLPRIEGPGAASPSVCADPAPAGLPLQTERLHVEISSQLAVELSARAEHYGVSLDLLLATAWAVLLSRWGDQETAAINISLPGDRKSKTGSGMRLSLSVELECDLSLYEAVCKVERDLRSAATVGPNSALLLEIVWTADLSLHVTLVVELARMPAGCAYRMLLGWDALLRAIAVQADERIGALPVLSRGEHELVIRAFNGGGHIKTHDYLLHELFELQAQKTPNALAVVSGNRELTYAELNCEANRLARYLKSRGVAANEVVGLCVRRGLDIAVGMLAILKSGGVYLPLDPQNPPERLRSILCDAAPSAVLTHAEFAQLLPDIGAANLVMEVATREARELKTIDLGRAERLPLDRAYMIYTSGSTGMPKGVDAPHAGMVNRILMHAVIAPFTDADRCCHKTSVGFVDSIFELLGPLAYGRPTVIASSDETSDLERLASLIAAERVTQLISVPSLAEAFLASEQLTGSLQTLRGWTLSGEELKPHLLHRLRQHLPRCKFRNIYGSSEVAADVTCHEVTSEEKDTVPIGRPIPNVPVYILNSFLQAVPVGTAGEIYVGGVAVAHGYHNAPELTSERFIADPFATGPDARLFKTGDRGCWLIDGSIEFLGRADRQVKIRGVRVELGEIEALLLEHDSVGEVAVVPRTVGLGEARLVAYLTLRSDRGDLVQSLRAHLLARLPDVMVPSGFVILDAMPLLSNGKLDRHSLPDPQSQICRTRPFELPRGTSEVRLAAVWREILGVDCVSRHDNFFELGGHSLLATAMVQRLRAMSLHVGARAVYERPVLADLAEVLIYEKTQAGALDDSECIGGEVVDPDVLALTKLRQEHVETIARAVPGGMRNIEDIYPLAPIQEGLLFHHLLLGQHDGDPYVLSILLAVESSQKLERMIDALNRLIERHPVLRTAVLWKDLPQPIQVVYRRAALPVMTIDLTPGCSALQSLYEAKRPQNQRLDLQTAPLLQIKVATDSHTSGSKVLLQVHHIICDQESLDLLLAELAALMEDAETRVAAPARYRDYVVGTLRSLLPEAAETYFRSKLQDVDEPTAPFDILGGRMAPAGIRQIRLILDKSLSGRLRALARKLAAPAAILFHTAWALIVARTSSRDDVVFGTVLSNRAHGTMPDDSTLGMFVNTLPIRLRIGASSVGEVVALTKRELIGLFAYEQTSLATAQRCSAVGPSTPLFSSILNYLHISPEQHRLLSARKPFELLSIDSWTNYPIVLCVEDDGEGFAVQLSTDSRIDPGRLSGYLQTTLAAMADALETDKQTPALRMPLLSEQELAVVLRGFNDTAVPYPCDLSIHERFEQMVDRSPDATAVASGSELVTYAQLNAKANRLARFIAHRGVGRSEPVAVFMERGLDLTVAQLAILKCGAVYVPIDSGMPARRVALILKDCAARYGLSCGALPAELEAESIDWIDCALEVQAIAQHAPLNLEVPLEAVPNAYIMYTSGSTGLPKGVVVTHRGVLRLVVNTRYVDITNTDCFAFTSSPAFDASTFEVWGALLNGAKLVVLPPAVVLDPKRFVTAITHHSVTILWMTVGLLAQYVDELGRALRALRYLITGGDVVEAHLVARIFKNGAPEHLLNAYGPTECTTFSTSFLIESPHSDTGRVPIGRPISNTRVYILDSMQQPVPVGVTGEIYIGGPGVAAGYLNRPETDAARFLADPFDGSSSGRLYRTGDLGRWRADGNIEFLGRNDRQVKLRGFRVEPGEIEARLLESPLVKEAAVVTRRDAQEDKQLVAYITAAPDTVAAEKELAVTLHRHLAAVLPHFMVPSVFVLLDQLPLTINGKLDRHALPPPDETAYASNGYEAPRGEVEMSVAAIWKDVLGVQRVGRSDDFFQIGGHSLLALRVIPELNKRFGQSMTISDLYQRPTLSEFAARVDGERGAAQLVDLSQEASLDKGIRGLPERTAPSAACIFLTGCTGFVGRFVLAELLERTDATIYCLVRADSRDSAASRVEQTLARWELAAGPPGSRVIPVPGDLGALNLGMTRYDYQRVSADVDNVIHCATQMNHLERYDSAHSVNVGGIRSLLELSITKRPKLFNYLSTVSVFSSLNRLAGRVVDETSPIEAEQHSVSDGYGASKWVGEKLVSIAASRDIPCNILRLGLVGPDSRLGRYDELQTECRILRSALMCGYGIEGYRQAMDPLPVDYVARCIVALAARDTQGGGIFHIASNKRSEEGLFERCNRVAATSLELVPFYQWICELKRLHREGRSLPAVPVLEFAFLMDEQRFRVHLEDAERMHVSVDSRRTEDKLALAGINRQEFDDETVRRCIDALVRHRFDSDSPRFFA